MSGAEGREQACRHCGKPPEQDGDHSCPCPYSDDDCPNHPLSGRTRLIREQQRDRTEEITAVMVSRDTDMAHSLVPVPEPNDPTAEALLRAIFGTDASHDSPSPGGTS